MCAWRMTPKRLSSNSSKTQERWPKSALSTAVHGQSGWRADPSSSCRLKVNSVAFQPRATVRERRSVGLACAARSPPGCSLRKTSSPHCWRVRSRTALAQMKRGLAPAGRPSSAPERCGDQLPDREPADIAAAARWIEEMRGMPGGGDLSGADALLGRLSPEALPRLLEELQRRGIDSHRVLVPAEGEEIELLRGASTAITAYLERHVWYLGANRHRGSQLSQIAVSGSPTDIGVSGEHVASVLRAYSQREVKNCPPAPGAEAPPGTLEAAVNYWARHLGVIAEYDVLDYGPGSEL